MNYICTLLLIIAKKSGEGLKCIIRIILLCVPLMTVSLKVKASKLEKGYEALAMYDYFLAKKLFTEIQNKKPDAYAAYGLSVIYSRNDNPFSNIDSAGKYIRLSYHRFLLFPQSLTLSTFTISQKSILELAESISVKMYEKVKVVNTLAAYDFFLSQFYLANKTLIKEAVYARDDIEYKQVLITNSSKETLSFLKTHPQSEFYPAALTLRDRQIYEESTPKRTADEYARFIKNNPGNMMVNTAQEKLFTMYAQSKDVKGLASFVRDYPNAHQSTEAWKLLFSLSVKDFSFAELEKFCLSYPEFPLKNSILNELELNKLVLYPCQWNDYSGFIDLNGRFVIRPVYDAVTDFYEGLSVVTKNDSVFFINKKNINPFGKIFNDALVFKNGIAPVKQDKHWCFINRQGQGISRFYDEINELSDETYVVRSEEKYGALDHFGKVIIEPRFDKLGDFKNGFAYYVEKGVYGFVSKSGATHKAEFEWISDFDTNAIAIIKKNNKYGLVNTYGTLVLEPAFEQIIKTNGEVYIVISNGQYGFFSSKGCFLSAIVFDYLKEKPAEYYTNGSLFRLIKKGEQAFMDENGRLTINFGAYQEINFESYDLIRVKQKNKYGFVDRKLTVIIPYKYSAATDFTDGLAMVKVKDQNVLITRAGIELFSSGAEISKVSKHYYLVNDELKSLINHEGEQVFTDVGSIQKINENLFIITLNNGEIKLLVD